MSSSFCHLPFLKMKGYNLIVKEFLFWTQMNAESCLAHSVFFVSGVICANLRPIESKEEMRGLKNV